MTLLFILFITTLVLILANIIRLIFRDKTLLSQRFKDISINLLQEKISTPESELTVNRTHEIIEKINQFLFKRLKISPVEKGKPLSIVIAGAGWHSKNALIIYTLIQLLLPTIVAMYVWTTSITPFDYGPAIVERLIETMIALVIAAKIPSWILQKARQSYQDKIKKSLPDAIDIILMCFEAGYSNDATLEIIGKEFKYVTPEIATEFEITRTELKLLPSRHEAWENLAARIDIDQMLNLVSTLEQNDRYGTSAVDSLRALIKHTRQQRMLRAEEQGGKLSTKLMLPMILFFFPIIFILILTPSIVNLISAFSQSGL